MKQQQMAPQMKMTKAPTTSQPIPTTKKMTDKQMNLQEAANTKTSPPQKHKRKGNRATTPSTMAATQTTA